MLIHLEKSNGISILRQMADQIRAQCSSGKLLPGQQMPATRALALQLGVNQNTVHRAYDRLAAEGLLERRNGEGTFVAISMDATPMDVQREQLRQEIRRLVNRSLMLGLNPEDFFNLIDEALSAQPPEHAAANPPTQEGASPRNTENE